MRTQTQTHMHEWTAHSVCFNTLKQTFLKRKCERNHCSSGHSWTFHRRPAMTHTHTHTHLREVEGIGQSHKHIQVLIVSLWLNQPDLKVLTSHTVVNRDGNSWPLFPNHFKFHITKCTKMRIFLGKIYLGSSKANTCLFLLLFLHSSKSTEALGLCERYGLQCYQLSCSSVTAAPRPTNNSVPSP